MALIGNILKPLAKSVSISLGLTATALATNRCVYSEGNVWIWRDDIYNFQLKKWMKINKLLEDSGLLTKDKGKTIKSKPKEPKGWFLGMLLDALGAALWENLLLFKGTIRKVKAWLELVRIFHAASSFNKFWKTKVLPKQT